VVAAAESIRSSVTAARGRSEAIHPRLALKHVQAIREEIKVLVPILERIHLRLK